MSFKGVIDNIVNWFGCFLTTCIHNLRISLPLAHLSCSLFLIVTAVNSEGDVMGDRWTMRLRMWFGALFFLHWAEMHALCSDIYNLCTLWWLIWIVSESCLRRVNCALWVIQKATGKTLFKLKLSSKIHLFLKLFLRIVLSEACWSFGYILFSVYRVKLER